MSRLLPSLAAVAIGTAALTACGSSSTDTTSSGSTHVKVTLASGNSCSYDTTSVKAGPVTFDVTNTGATGLTEFEVMDGERIIGEKENVAPGLPTGTFTLTLDGGSYTLYCPGGIPEKSALTVTGTAATKKATSASELLAGGAQEYKQYVQDQVDGLVLSVQRLDEAVASGDVAAAKKAYAVARPFYEKVESDVEGFTLPGFKADDNRGNLDYLIDMRASSLDPTVGWSGFHAVERDLFRDGKITAQTRTYASDLVTNVTKLATVAKTLEFKPEDLANGAAGLLEEVQTGKVSGEEENFGHIDLVDLAYNVEGAHQAYESLKAGLATINPALVATIDARFASVDALIDSYRDPNALGGFRPYTATFKAAHANKLSQTVQGLQDAMAQLAEKVATA